MIKKMRHRVILAAMLAFTFVIAVVAVLVNLVNYGEETRRIDETLSSIINFEAGSSEPGKPGGPPPAPFMGLPDLEANYMTRFFIVRFDKDENVESVYTDYIASIDEKEATELAVKVLSKKTERGYIGLYRYMKVDEKGKLSVVFVNASREIRSMRSLRILSLVIALISLAALYPLVYLFSGRAIRPIMRNIERQKQFITDAGHELKTPLTSIVTSLDVIAAEHGDDEWTDNIRHQTARMSKLVGELVTLSKMDEVAPLSGKEQFSISDAAWEIAEVYQPQIKAAGKTFDIDIAENVEMYGDKPAIQQMLSVLIDNAAKYSDPESEIRFTVSKKKSRVFIEVFNTCQYDTPPDEERLFDRFYRPDESRSADSGGNGVGLAIAKAVVEKHAGTIKASCPSGRSMTITVLI